MLRFSLVLFSATLLFSLSNCKQESKDKAAETQQVQPQATPQPNVQLPPDFTPVSGPPPSRLKMQKVYGILPARKDVMEVQAQQEVVQNVELHWCTTRHTTKIDFLKGIIQSQVEV